MFLSHLYVRQLLYKCEYKYQDILDNWDNFVVNIEIWFRVLSHTPNYDKCNIKDFYLKI